MRKYSSKNIKAAINIYIYIYIYIHNDKNNNNIHQWYTLFLFHEIHQNRIARTLFHLVEKTNTPANKNKTKTTKTKSSSRWNRMIEKHFGAEGCTWHPSSLSLTWLHRLAVSRWPSRRSPESVSLQRTLQLSSGRC